MEVLEVHPHHWLSLVHVAEGQRDSSTGPQQMLIIWELFIFRIINVGFIFLVIRKRLTYHAAITDGIACRPLDYGVWDACET